METKTITNEINQILEDIYELIKTDERTKDDFNEYLKTMGVYGLADDKIKEYYTPYIFERAIPNLEVNPIMLYNDSKSSELSKAMEKSFKSIFLVKKVLKNGYEAYNLINEKTYKLNVTTKMTDYRGIGVGQYIVARICEYQNNIYIIEMAGHLAATQSDEAMRYAMAKIIQEPYSVYEDNPDKEHEIKMNIAFMYSKFIEAFESGELVTTSTYADEIIGQFNDFVENGTPVDVEDKLVVPEKLKFFEIDDLKNDYDNFIEKSLDGFSSHKKVYDTGIIYDKNYGLYIIPFYETLLTILEENSLKKIENAKECIKHFVTSPTISINILDRIYKRYPNFLDLANKVMGENLTMEELYNKYKYEYVAHRILSQTTILYNSKVFTNTLGMVVEKEKYSGIDYSNVGRNDPCPCGSGKKYKNCCLKK